MNRFYHLIPAALGALALSAVATAPATAEAARVHVRPAHVHVRPAPPPPLRVWVPGHWTFNVELGHKVWVEAGYRSAPRRDAVWVPGHWEGRGRARHWVAGHWR